MNESQIVKQAVDAIFEHQYWALSYDEERDYAELVNLRTDGLWALEMASKVTWAHDDFHEDFHCVIKQLIKSCRTNG